MASGNGWYLIGPLIAVGLVGLLGAVFWRMGLHWTFGREDGDRYADGLAIFGERDDSEPHIGDYGFGDRDRDFGERNGPADGDYGLLSPAAVTDDAEVAGEIRRLLGAAGIRATQAIDREGRTAVLVFAEEVEEARRLVGGSPAL
ncbi:hypothetical protein ACQP2F_40730 [Actinoplanes sp. CA-030573]|uniref:hypothetical protein n=1 Tax=Actinoplanes sp. CA-030573 TaxID=3239898 RepID=UPI003D8B9EBE